MRRILTFGFVAAVGCFLALAGCNGGGGGGGGGPAPGSQPGGGTQVNCQAIIGILEGTSKAVDKAMGAGDFISWLMDFAKQGPEKAEPGPRQCFDIDKTVVSNTKIRFVFNFRRCEFTDTENGQERTTEISGTIEIEGEDPTYGGSDPLNDPVFEPLIYDVTFSEFDYRSRPASGPGRIEEFHIEELSFHAELPQNCPGTGSFTLDGDLEVTISGDQNEHYLLSYNGFSGAFQFDAACEITGTTLNGGLSYQDLQSGPGAPSIDAQYSDFTISWTETDDGTLIIYNGGISGACIGDTDLDTVTEVFSPDTGDCPTSGDIIVNSQAGGSQLCEITIQNDGSVTIRDSQTGEVTTLPSCHDYEPCL